MRDFISYKEIFLSSEQVIFKEQEQVLARLANLIKEIKADGPILIRSLRRQEAAPELPREEAEQVSLPVAPPPDYHEQELDQMMIPPAPPPPPMPPKPGFWRFPEAEFRGLNRSRNEN